MTQPHPEPSEEASSLPVVIPLELIPSEEARESWRYSYPDGLTAQQAANEISDYGFMLEQVPKVYMHVTAGRLSKTNYHSHAVIGVADEVRNDEIEEAVEEAMEEKWDALKAAPVVDVERIMALADRVVTARIEYQDTRRSGEWATYDAAREALRAALASPEGSPR